MLGFLVVGTRFLFLLDLGADGAGAYGHLHGVDGGAGGHGEGVDGFERVFAAIDVDLFDGHIGNRAGDRGFDRSLFQWELVVLGVLANDNEIGREGFVRFIVFLCNNVAAAERNKAKKSEAFAPE